MFHSQLLKQSSIPPEEIVSLAISGHSLGVVPIGKDGRLLRKTTPIWSDQRATQEAASLGAAALALKGIGLWSDYQPISQLHQVERRYQPKKKRLCFIRKRYYLVSDN